MMVDFCIREVHRRLSDPDVFMGRWKLVERHLNEVLQDGLQANMTRTLEGLGHAVKWTRKQDGTLIANVGPVDARGAVASDQGTGTILQGRGFVPSKDGRSQ